MDENHYLRAIGATDEQDRLRSMERFFREELEAAYEATDEIDMDEQPTEWSYRKGRQDALSTAYMLVVQCRFMHEDVV